MASSARWSPWNFSPFRWYPRPKPAPPIPPVPPVADDAPVSTRVVGAMNAERIRRGIPPLAEDPKLNGTALTWARSMARFMVLDHGAWAGRIMSVYPNSVAGENIGEGYATVADAMAGWMRSPRHRDAILSPSFTRAGAGRAVDSHDINYWCVDFISG